MYEVKITLDISPRFESALLRLADGLAGVHTTPPAPDPANAPAEVPPSPPPAPKNPVNPQPSASAPTVAPVQQMHPVATAAPSYTLEQINKAGADLLTVRPDLQAQLMGLCQQFGVQYAGQLKPEQFGAFATALRQLGANI